MSLPRQSQARQGEVLTAALTLLPILLVMAALVYYPAISTLVRSFQNLDLLQQETGEFVGLANYLEVLRSSDLWRALVRTLVVVAVTVPLELLIGLAAALLLNENFWGRGWVRTLAILPWFLPPVVTGFLWGWILNGQYGALNGLLYQLGFIEKYQYWLFNPTSQLIWVGVAHAWTRYPFPLIVLLAGLQSIPEEIYDAARIDGATGWQRFTRVTFPLLLPAFSIALVVEFIFAFQVFDIIWSLTAGGSAGSGINPYTKTLMIYNYELVFKNLNLGTGSALSYIILAISLFLGLNFLRVLNRRDG